MLNLKIIKKTDFEKIINKLEDLEFKIADLTKERDQLAEDLEFAKKKIESLASKEKYTIINQKKKWLGGYPGEAFKKEQ
jgi:hypothetical protein